MRVRLHWTINGHEDHADLEGTNDEEINSQIEDVMKRRGLNGEKHNLWTRTLDI